MMVKCSAGTTWKPARCNTREEVDLYVPGGPGAAQVGGRADLQASGSPIAAIQIDWQVTGLGRTKRGASGTSKIDGCQPGHGVPDGVDDDDAVGDWCKVAAIAAENAKQKMPR